MGMERRFRDDRRVGVDDFDWLTPAEELRIPRDHARGLYDEALRRAMDPGSRHAADHYLELLAAYEPEEPLLDPGRHTLTMRIGQRRHRSSSRRSGVPGKRSLTADLARPAANDSIAVWPTRLHIAGGAQPAGSSIHGPRPDVRSAA